MSRLFCKRTPTPPGTQRSSSSRTRVDNQCYKAYEINCCGGVVEKNRDYEAGGRIAFAWWASAGRTKNLIFECSRFCLFFCVWSTRQTKRPTSILHLATLNLIVLHAVSLLFSAQPNLEGLGGDARWDYYSGLLVHGLVLLHLLTRFAAKFSGFSSVILPCILFCFSHRYNRTTIKKKIFLNVQR